MKLTSACAAACSCLQENLREFRPDGEVLLHVFSLPQSGAALGGFVLDAGPAGLQLLQPMSHCGSGLRLPPAQSPALLLSPCHLLGDQNQVPLMGDIKNKIRYCAELPYLCATALVTASSFMEELFSPRITPQKCIVVERLAC